MEKATAKVTAKATTKATAKVVPIEYQPVPGKIDETTFKNDVLGFDDDTDDDGNDLGGDENDAVRVFKNAVGRRVLVHEGRTYLHGGRYNHRTVGGFIVHYWLCAERKCAAVFKTLTNGGRHTVSVNTAVMPHNHKSESPGGAIIYLSPAALWG